jgi:PAS domain-containing protein
MRQRELSSLLSLNFFGQNTRVGTDVKNGENGFLRILLVEEDDVRAFVAQCEINKIEVPCSLRRSNSLPANSANLQACHASLILLGDAFSTPACLSDLRRDRSSIPIICLIAEPDPARADRLIRSGATDCLYSSQIRGLSACLASRLSGHPSATPFYLEFKSSAPVEFLSLRSERLRELCNCARDRAQNFVKSLPPSYRRLSDLTDQRLSQLDLFCARIWRITRARLQSVSSRWNLHRALILFRRRPSQNHPLPKTNLPPRASQALNPAPRRNLRSPIPLPDAPALAAHRFGSPGSLRDEDQEYNEAFHSVELAFKALFHSSFDALLLLDNSAAILHANAAAIALFGSSHANLLGKRLFDFASPTHRESLNSSWEMLLTLASHEGDFQLAAASVPRALHFRGRTNLWFGVHLLVLRETPLALRETPTSESSLVS